MNRARLRFLAAAHSSDVELPLSMSKVLKPPMRVINLSLSLCVCLGFGEQCVNGIQFLRWSEDFGIVAVNRKSQYCFQGLGTDLDVANTKRGVDRELVPLDLR